MPCLKGKPRRSNARSRADLAVAWLKGTLRLHVALGRSADRAGHLLREAERRAEHLRHARELLAVGRGRRRAAA